MARIGRLFALAGVGVRAEGQLVPFNRGAARWLGIWLDFRLSFREDIRISATRARRAEARLPSTARRHGVPPLPARHLQEAIVASASLYGAEAKWRGQRFVEEEVQRSVNRISRATLGVMRSTPVSSLSAVGGSMPARVRSNQRQAAFAARTISSSFPSTRRIAFGSSPLASRLRRALGFTLSHEGLPAVERVHGSRSLSFPGMICIPEAPRSAEDKEGRNQGAIDFASGFLENPLAVWTDGSAVEGVGYAAAVVFRSQEQEVEGEPGERDQEYVRVFRRGVLGSGSRKERNRRTYNQCSRSLRSQDRGSGWASRTFSLGVGQTAFDAELTAVVRGLELLAIRRGPGRSLRVFTDSQAFMLRLQPDAPGPGQSLARRGTWSARAIVEVPRPSVSIHWAPGHVGVEGNGLAGACAGEAALRGVCLGPQEVSMAVLRVQRSRQATAEWREDIIRGCGGRAPFAIPSPGTRPTIPAGARSAPKRIAARIFQLYSGHMMLASFLRDRYRWIEYDTCWRCGGGGQTREHVLKGCVAWKEEIRALWRRVGQASMSDRKEEDRKEGDRKERDIQGGRRYRGRKGFYLGLYGRSSARQYECEEALVR